MKTLISLGCIAVVLVGAPAWAKTVTQGTLDIQHLATQITGELKEYSRERDVLVENIHSVQEGIQKLKKEYQEAPTDKDKTMIRARTLKETSDLLDFYSQFYALNIQTVNAILPKLEKMKQAARKGALGKVARQLEDKAFKQNLSTLYGNLSAFAMTFGGPKTKKEVAVLLKENALLYQNSKSGVGIFKNIMENIDKVAGYLRSVYATTRLRTQILEQRKFQAKLAVDLMEYALALKPLQEAMVQMNAEGVMEVPEIELDEFVDPIIEGADASTGNGFMVDHDPEVDRILKQYQDGPAFLK